LHNKYPENGGKAEDGTMGRSTIADMWAALVWITKNEARVIEALIRANEVAGREPNNEQALERLAVLTDAAEFLFQLAPRERAVAELMATSRVPHHPEYSTDTADMVPGDDVLLRARLEELYLDECRVRIEANRISHSIPIWLGAIEGVRKVR
jgi:hypothetical protein